MDENKQSLSLSKLKTIVEEAINKAVDPIKKQISGVENRLGGVENRLGGVENKIGSIESRLGGIEARLDDPDTGLAAINRRLDANTGAVVELEKTVKGYADMYKINDSNIRKMEKRLETLEEDGGVHIPPELQLEPLPNPA